MELDRKDLVELVRLSQLCASAQQNLDHAEQRMQSALKEHRGHMTELQNFLNDHIDKLHRATK